MRDPEQEWTRLGAAIRLASIEQERQAILDAFPELRGRAAGASLKGTGQRRRFSAAAKRRMSAGMRKYWARRKAAAARKPRTA